MRESENAEGWLSVLKRQPAGTFGRGRGLQDEDEAEDGVCSMGSGKKYATLGWEERLFTELKEETMDEKTDEERTSVGMVGGR